MLFHRKSQSQTFVNGKFSLTEKTPFAGGINFLGWIVSSTNQDSWNQENIFSNVNLIQNSLNQNQLAIINILRMKIFEMMQQ